MRLSRLLGVCGVAAALSLALAGCHQLRSDLAEILINTTPPGAACTLTRMDQPIATVDPTPGIVMLDPSATSGVNVICRRSGFADVAIGLPPPVPSGKGGGPEPQRLDIPLGAPSPLARSR
jgi:hypothetical protein